jgi:hypothetical protein
MDDNKFTEEEIDFESVLQHFIAVCDDFGVDPTERILDVLYKNGIEV